MQRLNDATKRRIQHYNNVIIIFKSAVGLCNCLQVNICIFHAEVLYDEIQNCIYSPSSDLCEVIFHNNAQKCNWILRSVYSGYS